MKKWSDEDGVDFKNSDICYGKEFKPETNTIDIAKISIRGDFPSKEEWGYLEESDEMAVVIKGEGYIESKKDGKHMLKAGDVVYVEAGEHFRWGGNMDLIVPCAPAFEPAKHKIVSEE